MLPKRSFILYVFVLSSLVFTACSGVKPTAEVVEVEVTRIIEGTPETIVITSTPEEGEPELLPGSVEIFADGASFPLAVYSEWTYLYTYVDPAVIINYTATGSSKGKADIIAREVFFAGSDSLLKDEQYEEGGDLQMLPMLAGPVVLTYNDTIFYTEEEKTEFDDGFGGVDKKAAKKAGVEIPTLVLDRQTAADIFEKKVIRWNDEAIIVLNPDLADRLPDSAIDTVVRSDGSGTTEIFTKALSSFSESFAENVGADKAPQWPTAEGTNVLGGSKNAGVTSAVMQTPGSIGYVELSYAVNAGLPYADMINKAGNKVSANMDTLQNAMNDFAGTFSDRLTTDIVDAQGENSWPIAGYTYLIIRLESMDDCLKAEKLLDYITWCITSDEAAEIASKQGFATLPEPVAEMVLEKLGEVTCEGDLILSN